MSVLLAMQLGLPAPPAVPGAAPNLFAQPRGLAWCAGLSLVLHALLTVVALPGPADEAVPRQAERPPVRTARPLELRLIAAPVPAAAAPLEAAVGEAAAIAAAPPPQVAQRVARSAPPPAHEPVPPASQPSPASARSNVAASAADPMPAPAIARPAQASEHDDYLPRPLLTLAPAAQAPVLIGSPAVDLGIARHVGILALFIDEAGEVRHVSADGPALPPALEQAAREAFLAARFSPGELDGRAVKSRIRVEVVFDNMPLK